MAWLEGAETFQARRRACSTSKTILPGHAAKGLFSKEVASHADDRSAGLLVRHLQHSPPRILSNLFA